jgi:hypothetical protein
MEEAKVAKHLKCKGEKSLQTKNKQKKQDNFTRLTRHGMKHRERKRNRKR